jgi:hypothetical protein
MKSLVIIAGVIVVAIVTRQIVAGRQEGAFQKKGGTEMAVGVRQAPRGRLGAPPVLRLDAYL